MSKKIWISADSSDCPPDCPTIPLANFRAEQVEFPFVYIFDVRINFNNYFTQMKIGVFFCFILLLVNVRNEALQLYSVSSSPTQIVNPSGSIRGGTTIYITGVGFSTNAADNQVTIGTYPCKIPAAGATETTLSCVTSDTFQNNDIYNLPINVISNGQQQSLTNEQGCFSYLNSFTPVIQALFPASAVAGTYVNFYGVHRISNLGDGNRNMGDVISMNIGNALCGRFDIIQGPIQASSSDTISCHQAQVQEAGKYKVLEYLTPGYSTPDAKLRRSSLLQENYHFAVLPAIYSFTPNSGAPAGQQLTINGTGFSTNASEITVTVDENICDVTSSTDSTITCNLQPRNKNISSILNTNSLNQTNGYISGAGLNYKRFDITNLVTKTIAGFRTAVNSNSPTLVLQEASYRGEIKTGNYFGSYYGQVFTGYFTAPASGTYVFRGVADDAFAVYLSATFGSSEPASTPLIYSNNYQDYNNFYINYVPTAQASINLSAGESYYIEVYHLNYVGSGHLKLTTQIPNTDQTLYWQTHAVQQLVLNFTNDPEILNFTQTGGAGGQINLTATMKPTGLPSYVESAVINYNATISQFLAALNTFNCFSAYSLQGFLSTYDSNGLATNDSTKAYTYVWTVSVQYLRPSNATKVVFIPKFLNYVGNQSFTQTTVHAHGPVIVGSFGLMLGGNAITNAGSSYLRYSISASDLQASIRALPGFELTEVYLLSNSNYMQYGSTWLISYVGYNGPVPLLTTDNTYLMGGVSGTTPQLYSIELRAYSSDLLVTIDYPFLSTPSPQANVLITVNSVPSVCIGNCIYTFLLNSPQLTAASISGPTVTLTLTDPSSIGYSLNDVTVTIGGQSCAIANPSAPINNFQCILPKNADNTANVAAGSYMPVATIAQTGSAPPTSSIQPFIFPLTLTSLSITSGGANGGYVLTLAGTGFPSSLQTATITICGQQATIQSISNINAQIIVPSCPNLGSTSVSISNGIATSNTLPFNYVVGTPPATIFTVSPQSYNPSLKGIMIITGIGFGTNLTGIRVDLANSTGKVYRMRVLVLNDTYIKVGIPGGLTGKFKVQVNIIGVGQALPNTTSVNDFAYELVINSITPSTGSYNGGTLIHLKGINFSPALDETLVFIGNELNWMCNVEELNTTDILCRTPPISPYYNVSVPQDVVLTNRLMVDNTCGGTCSFSYIAEGQSPTLTKMSTNSITTGSIVLNGTNFSLGTPIVILTNLNTSLATKVTPTGVTATSLTFAVPSVESGQYDVKVRIDPIGETNSYLLVINAAITAKSPSTISVNGGRFVITGSGLPNGWPNINFALTVTQNKVVIQPSIFAATPTSFVVVLPTSTSGDSFSVTLKTPNNQILVATSTSQNANTPALTLVTPATASSGNIQFTFSQTNLVTVAANYVEIYSTYNPAEAYNGTITVNSAGTVQFSASLTGGIYGFRFYYNSYGWSSCLSTVSVSIASPTAPSAIVSSYLGGSFILSGSGLSKSGTVSINGVKTQLVNVTSSSAVAIIPPYVTTETQAAFSIASPQKLTRSQFAIISDSPATQNNAFDGFQGTIYSSSSSSTCYIGADVGSGLVFLLSRVRFFPNSKWLIASKYLIGATLQGSNDQTTWSTLATIDSTVHSGWNIVPISSSANYRYVRFAHDATSGCKLAQLQFEGIIQTGITLASLTSNSAQIIYADGANSFTLANGIEFKTDHTPIVQSLSQTSGDVFGNYSITLTGSYLNFETPTVVIDGISCVVTASTSTSITCTVGSRLSLPSANSFIVKVGNCLAVIKQSFKYVMRWSDIRTWGTDMPPIDGDLVYIPAGMTLLVDESTPVLQSILVENGTLMFADESDMIIQAGSITVVGGKFIAGTQNKPYQHQLTFIMHGGYYDAQQPMFGNKGIGCMECFISIHGEVRPYTWTMLSSSINIGANTLTVQDPVDWRVGEEIVVASTSFKHNEAERRFITAISGKTITVDSAFKNLHFAGVQTYGTDQIEMRAEVGLLTRNVKVMGDSTSVKQSYGAHLLMAGSAQNGLVGQIAYTEFTKCGQPRIIGRYCIHYHMNGDVSDSFARGNAVHDSMARVITLHGVHYLTVEYNVGYNVKGHNYFIEDGIETQNLLQYNLAISSIQVWTMLQTDISVASFWVTHPSNHFRYNHAAGSDFYGFWYEIKTNPDGPSACNDVCPIGNPLGECHDNVAHSNVRFGLRIFKLAPRTYPCSPLFTEDPYDPWALNPGVISTFSNYTLYKNGESGLLAEQTANLVFTNFTSAENGRSGAEFWITYFSKDLTVFENSVIIGQTKTNDPQPVPSAKGIITPRLGNIRINNIRFYNYPSGTHSIQTCSHCDHPLLFTNTAQEIYISNITFTNVSGNKLFMNGLKREILYDLDGSFTTTAFDGTQRTSAAVTYNYNHLASDPACLPTTSTQSWDNTIICDSSVKLVRVTFDHVQSVSLFYLTGQKAQEISNPAELVPENSTGFSEIYSFFSMSNKKDAMVSAPKTYAMPYIAGREYNIWWLTGLDFDHLTMSSSYYMKPTDPAVRFKFNYTLNRQLYEIGPIRPGEPLTESGYFVRANGYLDETSCYNGEYYHDNTAGNRTMELCASARNRTYFETTDVTAVYCKYLCPAPPGEFVKENFVRYWSNVTQWPFGRLPLAGENVTVNGNWTIIMDIDPAVCEFMTIDGEVIIEDIANRNITCQSIWIRAGSLTAGSAANPFTHSLTIQLNGNKNDPGYVFDPTLEGNKIFVITGKLTLYGTRPATVSTKLTSIAYAGDSSISVSSNSGWAVGDEIVIAPSFFNSREYERVTITGISGSTVSFTPALKYTHYGDPSITISNNIGTLDTRASVGHVTRSIKFVSGPDSGWGYTVVVYQLWEGANSRAGQATFSGVEFTLGGQYDTQAASLVLYNNLDTSTAQTVVTASSFSFCRSFCIKGYQQNNALVSDTVFYEARKFHFKLLQITAFTATNNVMIGAIIRPTMTGKEPVACIELTEIDPSIDAVTITNNICQGSDIDGYVMPFVPCSMINTMPFNNNTAGTALEVGFLLIRTTSDDCLAFSGARAYAVKVGHTSQPAGTSELQVSNYIIADSHLGLSLRYGLEGTDRSAYFSNSYITQISRPNCSVCYGANKISCSGNSAIRMLTVTINGETYPKSFDAGFDGLCKQQTFDSKAFLNNVVFDSYKNSYNESALSQCSNNFVFTTNHGASDFVGGHNLWNATCTNCQLGALAYFDPPRQNELGWFGGCGNITCTGKSNYIIEDHTDTFIPNGGILLANNSIIGDNTPGCTFVPSMNGYHCLRHDFGALQYESIAPDYNKRIMWPVSLTYDGGNWTTFTNGFKEWDWSGGEPLNHRLGRFISVIQLQKTYNMSFASNPPDDMHFQLQRRTTTGNNSDWIIVKIYYPFPNSIQVSVNGVVSKPISLLDNNGETALDTTKCGSNKFFYQNYTIHFVITGAINCLVRVRLTSSVQLTLRFSMNINDFFSTSGPTRLVDRMCAIFGITDQSRVKIVGVYNGSTIVMTQISTSTAADNTDSTSFDSSADITAANALSSKIQGVYSSGAMTSELSDFGLISMDATVVPVHPVSDTPEDDTNKKILIGVITSVGALIVITGAIIFYLKKRASNKVASEVPEFSSGSEASHDKGKSDEKQREIVEVQNITEQNISEVIFDRPN